MALTLTVVNYFAFPTSVPAGARYGVVSYTGLPAASDYALGGYNVDCRTYLRTIDHYNVVAEGLGAAATASVGSIAIDPTNLATGQFKIQVWGHSHPLFLKNADAVDAVGTRVNAGANLIGANTGVDLTVAALTVYVIGAHGGIGAVGTAPTELAALTDLSALRFRIQVWGAMF